jgi:hypothetical protein
VHFRQQGQAIPENPFTSFKFKGKCGLRYKIGVDILSGNSVWIIKPYAAGNYPDIVFFCSGLVHWLDEFKRVEADNGYIEEAPQKVS